MRPQRLSHQAAGARFAHTLGGPRVPAASAPPLRYGSPAARSRQRRIALAALLALHAAAVVGLLESGRLREVAVDARPLFLAVLDTTAPAVPPRPLPLPPSVKTPPPPSLALPLLETETAPAPSPSPLVAAVPSPAPAAPVAPAEAPVAPAPSIAQTIPPAAVQYLVPPAPVYSRMSARMRESGKALVRVFIDEAGLPRTVQLAASTGFARLDDAALAAVRKCRFRPYLDNGVAVAGWAAIPIEFELPT